MLQEDVQLLKKLNMDAFRFSISWSRIFPRKTKIYSLVNDSFAVYYEMHFLTTFCCWKQSDGKKDKGVSETGVKFYNDLINELIANGCYTFPHIFISYEISFFFSFNLVAKMAILIEFCRCNASCHIVSMGCTSGSWRWIRRFLEWPYFVSPLSQILIYVISVMSPIFLQLLNMFWNSYIGRISVILHSLLSINMVIEWSIGLL